MRQITFTITGWILTLAAIQFGSSAVANDGDLPNDPNANIPQVDALSTKIYRVSDIVFSVPDYPFSGFILPSVENKRPAPSSPYGQFSGGAVGGGARGGGLFSVPNQLGGGQGGIGGPGMPSQRWPGGSLGIDVDDIIDTLTQTIAPDSWDSDERVAISSLGEMIVVTQTDAVHARIDQFLKSLSASQSSGRRSITLKTYWIMLNGEQYAGLGLNDRQEIEPMRLAQISASGNRGQITCFDQQTVHLAAGRLKSSISSVIPVVGQNTLLNTAEQSLAADTDSPVPAKDSSRMNDAMPAHVFGQTLGLTPAGTGENSSGTNFSETARVGYQPLTQWVNYGAIVQMTPKLSESSDSVLLDIHSIIAMPIANLASNMSPMLTGLQIDRQNFNTQQFMTTLRIQNRTPMVVAGSAVEPATVNNNHVYLVVEAIINP